jgi:hypothetical protein
VRTQSCTLAASLPAASPAADVHAVRVTRCRLALHIQILLKIDRVDVAERELKNMSKMDDDATLTQITTAWVGMAMVSHSL